MSESQAWKSIQRSARYAPAAGAFSPATEVGLIFVSGQVPRDPITIYLADISAWGTVNQIFQEYFRPPFPARAVVGVSLEDFLIEVSAVAARPKEQP